MNTLRLRAEHSAQKFYNKRQNEPLEALAGDGAGNVDVTGRLNWIWVRVDGNAEAVTVAFNKSGHEFTEDDSIQIRWVKRTGLGYYEVTGYSGSAVYDNPSDTTQTTVLAHAAQHQRRDQGQGGFDPLDIYARMVVPLRARPQTSPNLTLHVETGYNPLTGNYYAGGDSAAFSAPTGLAQAKIDLLYLGSDDALHIVAGTPVAGGSPTLPALVVPSVPLAFVYLSTGQTTITESNIYRDPGILRAPVGAVSTGVTNYLDWFIVTDPTYGAVGDGLTNDTTAVQAALDAAAVNGGVVYFPAGTYLCDPLTTYRNVMLLGAGRDASTLQANAGGSLLSYSNVANINLKFTGGLRDLTLDGDATGAIGLDITGAWLLNLSGVRITGFTSIDAKLRAVLIAQCADCEFLSSATGLDADQATVGGSPVQFNLVRLERCDFLNNTSWGAHIANGASATFSTCLFQTNGTVGNAATGSLYYKMGSEHEGVGLVIDGGTWFEDCAGGYIVQIDNPAGTITYPAYTTCVIRDTNFLYNLTAVYGIYLDGTQYQHLMCENVVFRDNVSGGGADFHAGGVNAYINKYECYGTDGGTTANIARSIRSLDIFGASGVNHVVGIVPDPGALAGTTKFLREDATWQVPAAASGANPTAQVGASAVNGAAATFMRSDAAPKLADTAVTPGTYGSATQVGQFTVDQQGRLTAATNIAVSSSVIWSPLTNGDPVSPALVFDPANGDVIMIAT